MSDHYPDETLDWPVLQLADVMGFDLDETLHLNDAGETHRLYVVQPMNGRWP